MVDKDLMEQKKREYIEEQERIYTELLKSLEKDIDEKIYDHCYNYLNLEQEMKNMQKREISDDYNSFLNRKYPIKVNTKNYNHLISK